MWVIKKYIDKTTYPKKCILFDSPKDDYEQTPDILQELTTSERILRSTFNL